MVHEQEYIVKEYDGRVYRISKRWQVTCIVPGSVVWWRMYVFVCVCVYVRWRFSVVR